MAASLLWNDGEGYDLHVLRGGPPSKALDKSLDLSQFPTPVVFVPHFKGAPSSTALGVSVNTTTGVVTANVLTGPNPPKLRNFVMTVRQSPPGAGPFETIIRVHVHDSIQKIWLTPSELNVHDSADEARFTVLALFDDGVVGDISDWSQLTYAVANPQSLPLAVMPVRVFNKGDLFAGDPEPIGGRVIGRVIPDHPDSDEVSATLTLPPPHTGATAKAKVFVKPSWIDIAGHPLNKVTVEWVAGPIKPNESDSSSAKKNSIRSVLDNCANVLFIAEGFLQSQKDDFRKKVVERVVNEFRTQDVLEPFKLLKDSINYWSVFVESKEDNVGLLGEYEIGGGTTAELRRPEPPPPAPSPWSVQHMMHEAGLPIPSDPPLADPTAWTANRSVLYDLPATPPVDKKGVSDWNDLAKRTLLNERDTAFAFVHGDRPRASGQGRSGDEHLLPDTRRISEKSLKQFIENLRFGNVKIGATWEDSKPDFRRVCFVCKSPRTGGTATTFYFAAATALAFSAQVEPAADGTRIKPRQIDSTFSLDVYASVVAHECGHALGLGDEYASASTFDATLHPIPFDPNLQPDTLIAPVNSSTGFRVFDPDLIKWLWPRVNNAGVLDGSPDFQGLPDPPDFLVRLRKGSLSSFKKNDLVRIRETPVKRPPLSDPYGAILLRVDQVGTTSLSVAYVNPSGPHIDLTLFNPSKSYELVCTSLAPNQEFPLVAASIQARIGTTHAPLNLNPGAQGATCVVGRSKTAETPINLPTLTTIPRNKMDIVGLYEGGGYHDCGVFRPAGRCRMRGGLIATTPFCHVCRYLIVDAIDPTRHGALDKLYPEVKP